LEEVGAFRRVEPERRGDRPEYIPGWADAPVLLKPDIPVGADARELRDLLAPEPHRSAPADVRKTHRSGLQSRPPGAQKLPELSEVRHLCGGHITIRHPVSYNGRSNSTLNARPNGPNSTKRP
jgi:hypothetical protein